MADAGHRRLDVRDRHLIGTPPIRRETTQLYISGDGTVMQGMELPRRTGHATFVNGWAIGVETGHPWGNYTADGQLGPWSMTADGRDRTGPAAPGEPGVAPAPGARTRSPDEGDDDLPGLKFYVKRDWFSEVAFGDLDDAALRRAVAAAAAGPGDAVHRAAVPRVGAAGALAGRGAPDPAQLLAVSAQEARERVRRAAASTG